MEKIIVFILPKFAGSKSVDGTSTVTKKLIDSIESSGLKVAIITSHCDGLDKNYEIFNYGKNIISKLEYLKFALYARKTIKSMKGKYSVTLVTVVQPIIFSLVNLLAPNGIRKIMIYFDPYSVNLDTTKPKNKVKMLIDVINFNLSKKIFIIDFIYNDFINKWPKYTSKFEKISLPITLKKHRGKKEQIIDFDPNKEEMKLLYAGNFYSKIRNPNDMLFFLDGVNKTRKIKLDIYTNSETDQYNISKYDWAEVFEPIESEAIEEKFNEYDILVNLGNSSFNQVPSKIFSYVSSGKKILNFHTLDNDTSKLFLEKYPLNFNVKLSGDDCYLEKPYFMQWLKSSETSKIVDLNTLYSSNLADNVASDFIEKVYGEI